MAETETLDSSAHPPQLSDENPTGNEDQHMLDADKSAKDSDSDSQSDSDSEDDAQQNTQIQALETELLSNPSNYDTHVQVISLPILIHRVGRKKNVFRGKYFLYRLVVIQVFVSWDALGVTKVLTHWVQDWQWCLKSWDISKEFFEEKIRYYMLTLKLRCISLVTLPLYMM